MMCAEPLSRVKDLGLRYDRARGATATNRPLFTACSVLSRKKVIETKQEK